MQFIDLCDDTVFSPSLAKVYNDSVQRHKIANRYIVKLMISVKTSEKILVWLIRCFVTLKFSGIIVRV